MGLKYSPQKRSPLTVLQNLQETTVVVVQENLDVIDDLTKLAEQQFAALIGSQLALESQLQTIKDNIRTNHFASRFNTVVSSHHRSHATTSQRLTCTEHRSSHSNMLD